MKSFENYSLPTPILKAIHDMGFETPTPIQDGAIPTILSGKDLVGCAQTGTGKTAAFCIPVVTRLLKAKGSSALILVPTRELALQVSSVIENLTKYVSQFKFATLIGGEPLQKQFKALSRFPQLVVATPGRAIDHLQRETLRLKKIDFLVIDEADRMMDMGFLPQINEILKYYSGPRQTLLFSATFSPAVDKISSRFLKNPVKVGSELTHTPIGNIRQVAVYLQPEQKREYLLDDLNRYDGSVLIFARTKYRVDDLFKFLDSYGHQVTALHGDKSQGKRNRAMLDYRTGKARVLIATDIAARGLDVDSIRHVINYDLPEGLEDYVHRVGRTGRAGADGHSISFVTPRDRANWKKISRSIEDIEEVVVAGDLYSIPGENPPRTKIEKSTRGLRVRKKKSDRKRRFGK